MNRLLICFKQFWLAVDELLGVVACSVIYLPTGAYVPNAHKSISAIVGEAQLTGKRWSIVPNKLINTLAFLLGGGKNHCVRAALSEACYN